jgi:hypothetical protein
MRARRVRSWLVGLMALALLPLNAATLLGCKSYDDLKKELETTGVPLIDSVVPPTAKTGTTVTLRGFNFGTAIGKLGFQDANGNVAVAEVASWNSDLIVTKVPTLVGNPKESAIHLVTSDGKVLAFPHNFTIE